jgi:hypothetical protein
VDGFADLFLICDSRLSCFYVIVNAILARDPRGHGKNSRVFAGSAVFSFKSVLVIIAHPAALALYGCNCNLVGTPSSISVISATVAADESDSAARALSKTKNAPHTANMTVAVKDLCNFL